MAQASRERPGVYKTSPNLFSLRLSDDQKARAEAAAKVRSKTLSDLTRDALMTYVIGIEEEQRQQKAAKTKVKEEAFVPRNPQSPRIGLGLPFTLPGMTSAPAQTSILQPPSQPSPPPLAPQQIVIQNVTAPPGPGRDDIDVLVDYLAGSKNVVDKRERERIVEKIIKDSSSSLEDQKRVAKALDERITAKTPEQPKKSAWSWLK